MMTMTSSMLPDGCRAQLHGLATRVDLNGLEVVVLSCQSIYLQSVHSECSFLCSAQSQSLSQRQRRRMEWCLSPGTLGLWHDLGWPAQRENPVAKVSDHASTICNRTLDRGYKLYSSA